ncbi:hypothetical protein [Nonomuraea longispora]|nr:hypothetical protein [Nonomuraea longispora]
MLLTTMMGEAGREVAACETGEDARVTIDEVIRLARRLLPTPDGVAKPTP